MPLWRELRIKASAYRRLFQPRNQDVSVVLGDLERFCHAQKTTNIEGDPHSSALLEGRRQVWLRIQGYIRLDDDQIEALAQQAAQMEGD